MDETLKNFEQLGMFAFCCYQKSLMEYVLNRIELLKPKASPYALAASSDSTDQFLTVLDYFEDPPEDLSHVLFGRLQKRTSDHCGEGDRHQEFLSDSRCNHL